MVDLRINETLCPGEVRKPRQRREAFPVSLKCLLISKVYYKFTAHGVCLLLVFCHI